MQIGIDVGATKIESVVLEDNGQERHRSRIDCPKDYRSIVFSIKEIHQKLQDEFKLELPINISAIDVCRGRVNLTFDSCPVIERLS